MGYLKFTVARLSGNTPRMVELANNARHGGDSVRLRRAAATAISPADAAGLEFLSASLADDSDELVRAFSAFSLGREGGKSAVESLRAGLEDRADRVFVACAKTLLQLGTTGSVEEISLQLNQRGTQAQLALIPELASVDDSTEAASALEKLAEGDDEVVRRRATVALAKVDLPAAAQLATKFREDLSLYDRAAYESILLDFERAGGRAEDRN